jgi:hypothetical protein
MLVYANQLSFQGAGAEEAIFKAIGAWLKEQLGLGLHPNQLRQDGEFDGYRGEARSWLRIYATKEEEPELYAWVLKTRDENVWGRQWIVEVGLKSYGGTYDVSCIVKTDAHSTLVASPVMASQPRLIPYVVNNIQQADDADFTASVSGVAVRTVGQDRNSYIALRAEIERLDRDCPVVLVSPTKDGEYLVNPALLQKIMIGLAQVVEVSRDFNSYEMSDVLGPPWSAWSGAVNVLHIPTQTGRVRGHFFLSSAVAEWGATQHDRLSHLLAWVTNNTNIPRLRRHIRPEGVMQLALRRRMQIARAKSGQMDAAQLRLELEQGSLQAVEQQKYFDELVAENTEIEADRSELKSRLEDADEELVKKDYTIQALKDRLAKAGGGRTSDLDAESLLNVVCETHPPTPAECVELIESIYGEKCIVLATAKSSALDVNRFIYGRDLLRMLRRLVTEYRSKLMERGDAEARKVFGRYEYAAKESETVMANRAMRRERTFEYEGQPIEMFSHLKIGVDNDTGRTIRVHFHWDGQREKIVIGYCGAHLTIPSD